MGTDQQIRVIIGDGNIIGDGSAANVFKSETGSRRQSPAYTPPAPPDPGDPPPAPGPLPPGSRLPFSPNAAFTGRVSCFQTLARALLPLPHPRTPTRPHPLPPHSHTPISPHSPSSSLSLSSSSLSPSLPPHPHTPTPSSPTLITQAISGMGGVGKTQLAGEFAHRYGRFFHGVHWLAAAQPDALSTEIAACGLQMGLQPWPDTLAEQLAVTLHAWQTGGPRLVIFDNLEDVAAAREWLAALSGGPLRLLLTARRSNWPHDLGLDALPLDVFTPQESRDFLRATGVAGSDGDLESLAERLGHLPLALELAARYLRAHPRLSVTAYLGKLAHVLKDPAMRNWKADLGNPTGHDLDLLATFAVSWEQLPDGPARRLFLLAGYCAPNTPLPFTLLQEAADLETGVGDEALGRLESLGLLRAGETEAGSAIHPLLAEYARALLTAPALLPALAEVLARQARAANDLVDQTGDLVAFAPLLPHLRPIAQAAESENLTDAAVLWNELGYHLHTLADYAGARAAYKSALAIDEATFGPEHPNVAIRVNNLGGVLYALGDLAGARAACERALAIDEAAFGPDHPKVATDVNNLGGVLQDLGDLAGARASFERTLDILAQTLPSEHPHVAATWNNLGLVLQDLGDLAGARAAFKRSLAIDEAAFGPDHPNVACDVNNLGSVLKDLSDLTGARAACERALAIDEAVFGPDHPNVAIRVNNLGGLLQDLGDLTGARAVFERALAIDEAIFGPDHPKVATDVNNLGGLLQDLGDLTGACAAYERALAMLRAAYGEEHPQVATAHNNLGSVLYALGDLASARAAFKRALKIQEKVYGWEHPNTAITLWWIGTLENASGNKKKAHQYLKEALTILERSLPPEHPDIRRVRESLASVKRRIRDL